MPWQCSRRCIRWPDGGDSFEHAAIIGESVRIRTRPDASGAVIGSCSYAVLPVVASSEAGDHWSAVRLPDGRTGYVAKHIVRSPLDYRADFRKSADGWELVTLVSGD